MVVGAVAGVAFGLAAVAWWSLRLTLRVRAQSAGELARVGAYVALGVAAIGAFGGTLLLAGIVVALVVPLCACVAGFALAAYTADADDDDGGGDPDGEPPWWPSFERELRRYDRQRIRS
jgi:hypothetical protein